MTAANPWMVCQNTATSLLPVVVSNLTGATGITTGGEHSCAVLADGSVQCWGYNVFGQLGNGTTADSTTPVTVAW